MLGVCMDVTNPFIVAEYVESGSLAGLLLDCSISVSTTTAIGMCMDVACGMAHLHSEQLLHNDLASRNLLVSRRGNGYVVKVTAPLPH